MRRCALILCVFAGWPLGALSDTSSVERAGDVFAVALPLAALGITFYEKDSPGRFQFAKAIGVNTVVTLGLKATVDKERPDGDCCDAFPSGHTSTAFVSAAFLHRRYGLKRAIAAYAVASYVGYTRVDADRHAGEDVLAGAAIGFLSSWFLASRYENTQITPIVQKGFVGLQFSGRF